MAEDNLLKSRVIYSGLQTEKMESRERWHSLGWRVGLLDSQVLYCLRNSGKRTKTREF